MNGIFITTELGGKIAEQVRALQEEFDPKMARYLPPHITLTGSSGAGPLPADLGVEALQERILPITTTTAPIVLRFGPPERFVGRNIVSLRLDPHGPLRDLHERLKGCGLPFAAARYPFTPHCTLNMYPALAPEKLKRMLSVRVTRAFTIRTLCVYHTHEPQPPDLLFKASLEGDAALVTR